MPGDPDPEDADRSYHGGSAPAPALHGIQRQQAPVILPSQCPDQVDELLGVGARRHQLLSHSQRALGVATLVQRHYECQQRVNALRVLLQELLEMLVALRPGAALDDAVWLANLAAGLAVGESGTVAISREKLAQAMAALRRSKST